MGVAVHAALRSRPPTLVRREAERLLAHTLGQTREWVITHPEAELSPQHQTQFEQLIEQAAAGVPLPYLLGHWEFFGLDFIVTPDVLIPRPETELLIERALAFAYEQSKIKNQKSKILDVGTGSGIIAVTLAVKLPQAQITATDISHSALGIARQNAERQGVASRMEFTQSDLLQSFVIRNSSFDIICANLPYIPSTDLETLTVAQHEPRLALDGGPDGLSLIRRLLAESRRVLALGGGILLEIEYRQGAVAATLAQKAFPDARVRIHKDLAGLDRVVEVALEK